MKKGLIRMVKRSWGRIAVLVVAAFLLTGQVFFTSSAYADMIVEDDFVSLTDNEVGSGNGTLDLKLFTSETAENKQTGCGQNCFDGDDANTALPKGDGSSDAGSYVESYVTTAGKIQAFYDLNFPYTDPADRISEMVVFLDLNEVSGVFGDDNRLSLFDIILNPATIEGNPDPINTDVDSGQKPPNSPASGTQNYIDQVFTADMGTETIAWLDPVLLVPGSYYNLPLNEQGGGYADYAIFTGIDPYSLNVNDILLFNQTITFLSNGGETKFLSGSISGDDICIPGDPDCEAPPVGAVPEPATMLLLGTGLVGAAGVLRRRRKNRA